MGSTNYNSEPEPQSVNIELTWQSTFRIFLQAYMHGESAEARNSSLEELSRMAAAADQLRTVCTAMGGYETLSKMPAMLRECREALDLGGDSPDLVARLDELLAKIPS